MCKLRLVLGATAEEAAPRLLEAWRPRAAQRPRPSRRPRRRRRRGLGLRRA